MAAGKEIDWFTEHVPHWDAALSRRGLGKKRGARALFVGAYEGMCVDWTMRNVLTGPGASAVVIGSPGADKGACVGVRGKGVWNPSADAKLRRNMAELANDLTGTIDRVLSARDDAHQMMRVLELRTSKKETFDLIYIDAQSSRHAVETAALAFPMLRPKGVMIFTNYTHGKLHDASCPRRGIDGFLDAYVADVKVLRSGFHLFLERRATPLKLLPCRSEYFDGEEKEVRCA